MISDCSQYGPGQPAITYGLKGITYYQVNLTGPNRDLHSGGFGGTVANPANVLCKMMAALIDENGRVQIPGFYDDILKTLYPEGGEFPEWGGLKADNYRSMQPTGETIQYILAGNDMQKRLQLLNYFNEEHWFYKDQVVFLESVKEGMPYISKRQKNAQCIIIT